MEERRVVQTERLERIENKVDKIFKILEGNGGDGLVIKTDRNTQFVRFMSKFIWFIITPLYAGLIVLLYKALTG